MSERDQRQEDEILMLLVGIVVFAALTVFVGCKPAVRPNLQPLVAAVGAYQSITPATAPAPAPGKCVPCPDCRGTGKIGDGRVSYPCSPCNGTGKVCR